MCVCMCVYVCVSLCLTSFACQLSEIIIFTSLCRFVAVLRLHSMQCTSGHRFLVDPEGALIAIYDCPME